MSAYLCDDATFHVLASYATRHREPGSDSIQPATVSAPRAVQEAEGLFPRVERIDGAHWRVPLLGQGAAIAAALWCENIHSLKARYPDSWRGLVPGTYYVFRRVDSHRISLPRILGILRGLEYQSCEAVDYRESLGYAILAEIRRLAINEIADGWTLNDEELDALGGLAALRLALSL